MMKADEKLLNEATKRIRDAITKFIDATTWHAKQRKWAKELAGKLRKECKRYVKGKKELTKARTEEDKRKAIDKLAYEIYILSRTASSLCRHPEYERSWLCANSLIHSFLLAVCNLFEFFFDSAKRDDTLHAKTFVEWKGDEKPKQPKFEEGIHWSKKQPDKGAPEEKSFSQIVSQRLHHITWARVDESQLGWNEQEITKAFLVPIKKFQKALPSELHTEDFEKSVRELEETCKRFI